jgi:LuxR family transcriptional regulator, maltose regulon positive regulatory protein
MVEDQVESSRWNNGRVTGGWSGCERDALLASNLLTTKLHMPGAQPGFVARPRLVRQLDDGLDRGLVLVCAPAGSGKTSLLASWARAGSRPVAWLSLDPGDNDPARFWRHVFAALDLARPGMGARVAPLLSQSEPPPSEVLVTVLINELAEPGEVVLILDDYHLIESRRLHDAMDFLVSHLPQGLRLVLASRSEPPLPLARLRARGQIAEVDAGELRFTAAEAAELLAGTVPGEAVTALTRRTEGWAAGLRLAALSLRGQSDTARFVAEFSGSNRYVLDYLTEEVLESQPKDIRGFLLETSVLDRLSGPLCDALTGRSDSQPMLERIERAGLFLVPLDDVRGWWRYHHLFADLLRARLDAEQPGRARDLHSLAARWHEEHGLTDDAIRHALAAGDMTEAARLIERHFDAAYMTGERATIQRWLSAVPDSVMLQRPRLRLARLFAVLVFGDVPAAAMLLGAEDAGTGSAEPFSPSVGEAASLLVNIPAGFAIARAWLAYLRGDPETMASFASQASASLRPGQLMLESIYQLNLTLADWLRGMLPEAERGFTDLVARWRQLGESSLAARSCRFLGQVQRDRGRLDAAFRTYAEAVAIAEDPAQPRPPIAAYGYVGMAEAAYQRDELDEALRHVTDGIARGRQLSESEPLASGLVTLAWIRQAEGDSAGAVAAIEEAERSAPSTAVADLLNPIPAQRARLLLAQGDIAAAAAWAAARGIDAEDEPSYLRQHEHLVLVRLLLAQGRPDRALSLLTRLHEPAVRQDRTGNVIELLALRALAHAASGDRHSALGTLAEALTLGHPRGYVRVFADEGAPMAALLAHVGGVPADYLARVLRACRRGAADSRQQGLIDPLTVRELEVLALLAVGAPNQGIADQLVVTLDTVKKHVTHVLAKLGASNRTEAVARARQLGLITLPARELRHVASPGMLPRWPWHDDG